ncbi:MAG: RnfABCDGE type electron transport complex subunit B [Bacillota bacterium]
MLAPVATLMILGLLFGAGLAFASRVLAVKRDERIEAIEAMLPGVNCGGCGYAGCSAFSEAMVRGEASVMACSVCSNEVLAKVAEILGEEIDTSAVKTVALVCCWGTRDAAKARFSYSGIADCAAMEAIAGGHKLCEYGCLGGGSCVDACPFGAITMGKEGIPVVDVDRCTGCGKCVEACPRDIIDMVPVNQPVLLLCRAELGPRDARKVCSNACIGCGLCAKRCPQDAITMKNHLPVVDFDKCDGCGICIQVCPADCLESGEVLLKQDRVG